MNLITLHKFIDESKQVFYSFLDNCLYAFYSQEAMTDLQADKKELLQFYTSNKIKARFIEERLNEIEKNLAHGDKIEYPKAVLSNFYRKKLFNDYKVKNGREFARYKLPPSYKSGASYENKEDSYVLTQNRNFEIEFWERKGYGKDRWLIEADNLKKIYTFNRQNSIERQKLLFTEIRDLLSKHDQLKPVHLKRYKDLLKNFRWLHSFLEDVELPYKILRHFKKQFPHNNTACQNCGKVFSHIIHIIHKNYCDDIKCTIDRKKKRQRTNEQFGGYTISLTDGYIGTYGGSILTDKFGNPIRICRVCCRKVISNDSPSNFETCDNDYCKRNREKELTKLRVKTHRAKVKKDTN